VNALFLSALLCAPASAAVVVEAVAPAAPVAPMSGAIGAAVLPMSAIPGASSFAPSLGVSAAFAAFPGQAPMVVHLAPPAAAAAAPASAVSAAPASAVAVPVPGRARREMIPPTGTSATRSLPAVAPAQSVQDAPAAGAVGSLSARLDAAGDQSAAPTVGADGVTPAPAESAADEGARLFDNSTRRALLDDSDFARDGAKGGDDAVVAGAVVRPTASGSRSRLRPAAAVAADRSGSPLEPGETLRDAVGAPVSPAAGRFARAVAVSPSASRVSIHAVPGAASVPAGGVAAPAATAASFDRLSFESGSGLVVRIGAAPDSTLKTLTPKPFAAGTLPASSGAPSSLRHGAPVTSTEWLERRGLLETLSVTEAAADQAARAALASPVVVAPATLRREPAPVRRDSSAPLPDGLWWGLAFLPAAAVLLKDFL
jgi:hypothetical protein